MKLAYVAIAIGDKINDMKKISLPIIKRYAKEIGCDFILIEEQTELSKQSGKIDWEKFQIYDLLNTYDRIIYTDLDIIIRKDCPSLFDVVPEDCVGMYDEGHFKFDTDRQALIKRIANHYNIPIPNYSGTYGNFGVMIASKQHREMFKQPTYKEEDKNIDLFIDQTWINVMIEHLGYKRHNLDARFNRLDPNDFLGGPSKNDSYIIHYAGLKREQVPIQMMKDILSWGYKWKDLI